MTSVSTGPYVQGEKPPPLVYQFLDSAGAPIDITGYAAGFTIQEADGLAASYSASVTDPVNGKITYTWTGTEWPTSGHYRATVWCGNGTNRLASIMIKFDVRAPVGTVPGI